MNTTEAPHSFNVKCYDQNGYDTMFTVRADDGKEFFDKVTKLLVWLPKANFTPTKAIPQNGNHSAASPVAVGNVPTCQYHGPMKPSQYGGYFCPSKMGDGSYCNSKSDASPAS